MTFLVQFIRFRRGAPVPIRTLAFDAPDPLSALTRAKGLMAGRSYPMRTEALRVMDDGGRTLIDWTAPVTAEQPVAYIATSDPPTSYQHSKPVPLLAPEEIRPELRATALTTQRHQFEAGQPISYTEDGRSDIASGGFEIVELCDPGIHEPHYVIRSAEESSNRFVKEHELQEDLGARVRGR